MTNPISRSAAISVGTAFAVAVALVAALGICVSARADEADAKRLLKAMSDYMAAQKTISFGFDTNLEVVTKDHQRLLLASSGTINLSRPDKIRATRTGGFANVETIFDGKTLTVVGKNANLYTQIDVPGTLDHLIDELRDTYHRPVPGADLLVSNVYDELMPDVTDAKDLGSGVIGGVECDHLAFREKEIDWQIWIAQGAHPYPCRYVITSKQVEGGPQYSVQIRDWKAGSDVAADDFAFKNETGARKIDMKDIGDTDELPKLFTPVPSQSTASASTTGDGQLGQDAEQLRTALAGDPVVFTQQVMSVTLTSSADAMFPSGGWQISSDAPLLSKMLPTLSKLRNTKIVVGGYTDNVPIGSQLQATGISDNFDLSAKRAVSVVNYLASHGVNPDLVSAQAFGETHPVASNDTPDGRAKNRRVDITLTGDGT
jgi:hypothetical protein